MSEPGSTEQISKLPDAEKPAEKILKEISGQKIEQNLLDLAKIGGNVKELGKDVSVSRLAMSREDFQARDILKTRMEEAGMQTEQHPMGLIGTYPGKNPDLPAVMLMSHFDSVPNGGMYDGTYGVISGVEIIRLLNKNKIKLPRSIIVLAVTAEESSRFNVALMGSKAIFQGLTDEELDNHRLGDQSLREALIANGFNPEDVKSPRFKPGEISASVELHVSQNDSLEQHGKDLAIIDAIAAPDRSEITIGKTPIEPDDKEPPNAHYLNISIQGSSDHSGATPMDVIYRADSLALLSRFLTSGVLGPLEDLQKQGKDVDVSIGPLLIENQALNKIPGKTELTLRIGGNDIQAIDGLLKDINLHAEAVGIFYNGRKTKIQTVAIEKLQQRPVNKKFYKSSDIIPRQKLATRIIQIVRATARSYQIDQKKNVVGTIGTYSLNDKGQIILGLDIRGTDSEERTAAVQEIFKQLENEDELFEIKKLPGSSDPTPMDKSLVTLAETAIRENDLGSYETTFSPAGHDTQNAARIGIPTTMISIPSRNNGASHTPKEYSTPEDLERGAKALAALVFKLAT